MTRLTRNLATLAKHWFLILALGLLLASSLPCYAWWSSLFPENWTPPEQAEFNTDKLIQDFSYAGYQRGEQPIPTVAGPIFDVVASYGADPSGIDDSTAAIQAAIDAAGATGGGVVLLPAGTYRVAPVGNNEQALRISQSNVILRGAGVGETFIFNDSFLMRQKAVIRIAPPSVTLGAASSITADLDRPTRQIPVQNASSFQVGDQVRLQWEFTQGWIDEHNQGPWWSAPNNRPAPAKYLRQVLAIDPAGQWIEVDIPTRYTIKTRDNPTVQRISGQLSGVGIEALSIGNVQHPGTSNWSEGDWNIQGRAAYDAHASWLISCNHCVDSWLTQVESFQDTGNTTTCHMLSNGILLLNCSRFSILECVMQRSQYGGAGGNGYMFRIQDTNEALIQDSIAEFSRHGFVLSHAGSSGNVFLRCEDRETGRSTGTTGSYNTNGTGSDHHMHFSHSNLFDQCRGHNSFFTAHHRGNSGTTPHALTSAHGVYWNTYGSGSRGGAIVRSEQARYGYIIGTSGSRSSASVPTGGNTAPTDHLEGVGQGATLSPPSLYLEQRSRRQQGLLVFVDPEAIIPSTIAYPISAELFNYTEGPAHTEWAQISGPNTTIADPSSLQTTVDLLTSGTYVFEITATADQLSAAAQLTITVNNSIFNAPIQSIDHIVGRRQDNASPLGYYPDTNNNLIGTTGSDQDRTREDRNLVVAFSLPELASDETLDLAILDFEITAFRNHSGNNPGLRVYLLDSPDPTDTGTEFFFHGPSDPNPNTYFVGSSEIVAPPGNQVNFAPGDHPQSYTLSGPALTKLKAFYEDGATPSQSQAYFRFNLNNLVSGGGNGDLGGASLDRYLLDTQQNQPSLTLFGTPAPNSYPAWIASFDLSPEQQGFTQDPDGDGIPNGIEAWLGTNPTENSSGISSLTISDTSLTFSHPIATPPPSNVTGFYQWSPNLIDWFDANQQTDPISGVTVNFNVEIVDNTAQVTATPSNPITPLFIRLAASNDNTN